MRYDAVIIGGGLGGLECAYILARHGRSVLVLEQGHKAGGCLQSYRRGKHTFDTGFHYVGGLSEGQSLHAAFKYLDLLDLPWHRLDSDGFDRITIGKRNFVFAEGYDAFVQRLADDFPSERAALERYADLLRRTTASQFAAIGPHAEETADFNDLLMSTSAWKYLNETFRDPLLISVLSGTSLKMELRRETLPLFTFLHGNSGFVESSWRLRGDGELITNRLISGIRAQGGEIVCDAKVEELSEKDGQAEYAVCTNGERYYGDVFVSDIHPARTCRLLRRSRTVKRAYINRIRSIENTFGMFTVSLLVPPRSVRYFNYNRYIYLTDDVWDFYRKNGPVGGVLVSCRVPEDGGEYTSQIDILTPGLREEYAAWEGTTVGKRSGDYKLMKARKTKECLALAGQFLPGLEKQARFFTSTPLTWRDYTLTPDGSAYGMRKDYANPLMTMLSPATPLKNLVLTGQNLILHGVHGVTITAFHTCAEVLGREAIWKIVGES